MESTSQAEITASFCTLQNSAILRRSSSGSGRIVRHSSASAWMPISRSSLTQHSVKELREIGIQADALLCRTIRPLPEEERRKIALFCNVQKEAVISAWDVDSIYKIPMMLHQQMLDEIVCHKLAILAKAGDLAAWTKLVDA